MFNEDKKDPYGRLDMPKEEKSKRYFSPLMPFRVTIYFYFWLLRQIFIEQWKSIAQEQREQIRKSYLDQEELPTVILIGGWLLEMMFVFGGLALVSHFLVPIIFVNGYLLFALGVIFVLGTFFTFHLHTEEGFLYWKNKLL